MAIFKNNNTGEKTTESIIWFTTLPAALQGIRFVNSIILARILSPNDFGIMGIASVIIYYCNNLSSFGIGNAIVQREEINDDHMSAFFSFNLIVSCFLFCLFFFCSQWIATFFKIPELNDVIRIFSFIFIITAFYTTAYTKLRKDLLFKYIAIVEAIKVAVAVPTSLFFALNGCQYWSMVYGILLSNIVATVVINFKASYVPKMNFKLNVLFDLIHFASWNFLAVQIRLLGMYVDKLIIGKFLGPVSLGFYEKSFGLASMPHEHMASKISSIAFSTFSQCQSDKQELVYYLKKNIVICSFVVFPFFIGLYSIADNFVLVLLGDKWVPMIPTFKVLLFAFMVSSITEIISTLNISCGSYRYQIAFRCFFVLILVLFVLLMVKNGIVYVAWVILAHNVLFFFVSFALLRKVVSYSFSNFAKTICPAFAGSMLILLAVNIVTKMASLDSCMMTLIISVFTGVLVYSFWFMFFSFKEWNFLKVKALKILSRYY